MCAVASAVDDMKPIILVVDDEKSVLEMAENIVHGGIPGGKGEGPENNEKGRFNQHGIERFPVSAHPFKAAPRIQ